MLRAQHRRRLMAGAIATAALFMQSAAALADSLEYALRLQGGEITRRTERDSTSGHSA